MNFIQFIGGFADRQAVELRRSPKLLRVVCSKDGKFDALDQLEDSPAADEDVFVYLRGEEPLSYGMIDYRGDGGGRRGGAYLMWEYLALDEPPPADAILRDTAAWQSWCRENADRLLRRLVSAGGGT